LLDDRGQPVPFDRDAITPHSFRHTYAQTLADQGVPAPVLRDLMDHRSLDTTLGYYRVTDTRKRDAMQLMASHTIDNRGPLGAASDERSGVAELREQLSWVAVPMGKCSEPTNVRAGGQACPIRYQKRRMSALRVRPFLLARAPQLRRRTASRA
jgi:Phage integrase family